MAVATTTPPTLTEKDVARFWSKVDRSNPDGCWPWTAGVDQKDGYGKFTICNNGVKRHLRAHRVAILIVTGQWSEVGMHHCDNPPCCRVDVQHAQPGTITDNAADMVRKNRQALGDRNGKRTHPEKVQYGDAHWTHMRPDRVARGERCGPSVLTEEQVRAIRAGRARGETYQALADRFGIGKSTAYHVINDQWLWLDK